MAELTTDSAALAAESDHFGQICADLSQAIKQVESTGEELRANWEGEAARAALAGLGDFHEAARTQEKMLNDLQGDLGITGKDYSGMDSDQAAALQQGF
ncbi:WXG100 family type VII secretion target [Mycobacterium sp.]|uniref:WXG100 family type VII secretion target n=1 Tax=Mycobacterium sp. TaxID=1785 RepID=UPI002BDEF661|nr:WXG100 family type VII secretion target [Mycobacterium sp.]HTQ21548.1 WXG100 family type VII secretion target [Mycobacterium sp.]